VFLFTEVLAWAKEKRPSVTNAWMIKEVDWESNQDLLQVYFYLTTSILVHIKQEIKFYTFWIRIRAS
jgi:hypothetical protein